MRASGMVMYMRERGQVMTNLLDKCAVCTEPIDRNSAGVSVEEWCVWHTYHDKESEGK